MEGCFWFADTKDVNLPTVMRVSLEADSPQLSAEMNAGLADIWIQAL